MNLHSTAEKFDQSDAEYCNYSGIANSIFDNPSELLLTWNCQNFALMLDPSLLDHEEKVAGKIKNHILGE